MLANLVRFSIVIFVWGGVSLFGMADRLLDERQGEIAANEVRRLTVDVKAGWLKIYGQPELNGVVYEAEFRGSSPEVLDRLEFDHRVQGDTLFVTTRTDTGRWRESGRINLTLYVPSNLDLEVIDSSGSMDIQDISGDVSIDDSSGSIEVDNVGQDLRIDDSSGSIKVRDVGGSADIDDSAGSISVSGVGGSVVVADSSGSITVRDVQGDFAVKSDGSGRIDYSGVSGQVSIPRKKR